MSGDPVTVFDTARTAAIEVMARAMSTDNRHGVFYESEHPAWLRSATAALDALLAARSSTTCETCGGTGSYAEHDPGCYGNCEKHGCPIQAQCQPCKGSGTVPGGPVLLDLVAEPAGMKWVPESESHGKFSTFEHKPLPVYRAREST